MQNDRQIKISAAGSRKATVWKPQENWVSELYEMLKTPVRSTESLQEYLKQSKSKQDNLKDVGGFVGGTLAGNRRGSNTVIGRDLITLDLDNIPAGNTQDTLLRLEALGCGYAVYSTRKHEEVKPRLRVLLPLNRTCTADEYEPIARKIASIIGIKLCDPTTFQASRLMYWPSCCSDSQYVYQYGDKPFLDADGILNLYHDWRNIAEWPQVPGAPQAQIKYASKQSDPTAKAGVVGAFCKIYDVFNAIETFIPDAYAVCDIGDRLTYTGGSTTGGAIIYDNGNFIYSHHATDPTGGKLCNAFDLVRLHLFGDQDDDAKPDTPTNKLPSYVEMCKFAVNDEKVKLAIFNEKLAGAREEFSDITNMVQGEESNSDWALSLSTDKNDQYSPTIDNVKIILENDPILRKKIRFNEFTKKYKMLGALPWDKSNSEKDWTDTDDAGLRYYFEKWYGIKRKNAMEDAWILVANENKYHPVKEYLNNLLWDGIPRVDTLFIVYLGANDTEYVKAVTRKSLAAAVARIFIPGIKYDHMLVLVGPQNCGKSQIIKRLGRDWFSDTLATIQGKEAYEQIQGFWIIEIAELAATRKQDIEATKHFITKSEDAYRAAYGHHVETYKRQCVFFGTTNKYEFLRDMTGNRRFWPVDVNPTRATKDMWQALTPEVVDQVWAEAVVLFNKGEKIFFDDENLKALAEEEQNRHLEESPLTGDIKRYLDKLLPEGWDNCDLSARRMYYQGNNFMAKVESSVLRDRVCPLEIWCELLNGDKKDMTLQRSREIKEIITKTGEWEQMKHPLTFGDLYGKQRGFYRINVQQPAEKLLP